MGNGRGPALILFDDQSSSEGCAHSGERQFPTVRGE